MRYRCVTPYWICVVENHRADQLAICFLDITSIYLKGCLDEAGRDRPSFSCCKHQASQKRTNTARCILQCTRETKVRRAWCLKPFYLAWRGIGIGIPQCRRPLRGAHCKVMTFLLTFRIPTSALPGPSPVAGYRTVACSSSVHKVPSL